MKSFFKVIGGIVLTIVLCFIIYISEESIRLQKYKGAIPLIVMSSDANVKSGNDEIQNIYNSIGFSLYINAVEEKNTGDNVVLKIIGEEFRLFNKITIWGYIE